MSTQLHLDSPRRVIYPDSDGQPMADNTLQFEWIVTLKGNLDALFRDNPDVFVAGDLLWYPVEGDNTISTAPDVMVAFGRPKGYRGSYRQWEEARVAPQVVFEVLSPGNRIPEMVRKQRFYERYGVEEYYLYDPEQEELTVWIRRGQELTEVDEPDGWTSPRLGIRFQFDQGQLRVYMPDGRPFATYVELYEQSEQSRQAADRERQRAEQERERAEHERQRADRLADKLRSLGLNPDELDKDQSTSH